MPLIKPRTRGKQLVRHIARLDRETNETLYAYAQFIGEPTDYVLNQVIDTVLAQGQGVSGVARRPSRVVRAAARPASPPSAATSASGATAAPRSAAVAPPRRFGARVDRQEAGRDGANRLLEQRALVAMLVATGCGRAGCPRLSGRPRQRLSAADRTAQSRGLPRAGVRVRDALVHDAVLRRVHARVARDHRRVPVSARAHARDRCRPTCAPEKRPTPTLVLGETHFETTTGRAPAPSWLTIPQRGLYTGVMIVGAVGTGKTSACMYPYADQLLRWRAGDPDRKIGGLVLEVKGDFCQQVRGHARTAGRESRLRRDRARRRRLLQPAAQRSRSRTRSPTPIATLLNNLFGKSKEPFWQQAYTDLLKFVILLRRLADGYTTLAEVYRYILEDAQDRERDQQAEGHAEPSRRK